MCMHGNVLTSADQHVCMHGNVENVLMLLHSRTANGVLGMVALASRRTPMKMNGKRCGVSAVATGVGLAILAIAALG